MSIVEIEILLSFSSLSFCIRRSPLATQLPLLCHASESRPRSQTTPAHTCQKTHQLIPYTIRHTRRGIYNQTSPWDRLFAPEDGGFRPSPARSLCSPGSCYASSPSSHVRRFVAPNSQRPPAIQQTRFSIEAFTRAACSPDRRIAHVPLYSSIPSVGMSIALNLVHHPLVMIFMPCRHQLSVLTRGNQVALSQRAARDQSMG
ncbi:hypothetical protein CLIM01_07090 [Colletotrichum limetticola]|uniref:Uncharacterized protein n=1 Tax=Colletotrichum limetticola TaxID=1209924 RepID=A0ABQ9PVH1_9PEZI|nr:hypothetical protein CLIM01_07090 [Colletotrichum limetticola]